MIFGNCEQLLCLNWMFIGKIDCRFTHFDACGNKQTVHTLHNVCSVHLGDTMSTLGGYHEYIGGEGGGGEGGIV